MKQHEDRPPLWAQVLVVSGTLAANLMVVWASLPPQERLWIRLAVTGGLRDLAGRQARAAGRSGIAREATDRDPSLLYGAALMLSRVRDGLSKSLEALR